MKLNKTEIEILDKLKNYSRLHCEAVMENGRRYNFREFNAFCSLVDKGLVTLISRGSAKGGRAVSRIFGRTDGYITNTSLFITIAKNPTVEI